MKISDIDPNLKVPETLNLPDVKWLPAGSNEFRLYGTFIPLQENESGPFRRLPDDIAAATNPGVRGLATNTASLRLRFRTDSPYIAIHAEWDVTCGFPHMPLTGTSGFDLYLIRDDSAQIQQFAGTFVPPYGVANGYESVISTPCGMQDMVLYFPLYNNVTRLYIGVRDGSTFEAPAEYSRELPMLFYGSSITQGGCASRPANAYQNMLSRGLDIDVVNLGFSGSARGEQTIAEYIATLPMLAFVCDYDHNAPDEAHLARTHYPFYKTIRDKRPELPVVFLSKPDGRCVTPDAVNINLRRAAIVRDTYDRARAAGDNNVYFIDGFSLFADDVLQAATVDTCHPNDLGFYYFYKALKPVLESILDH